VTDYYLRRAGLDYWEHLNPTHYQDWEDFLARNPARRLWFFSTRGELTVERGAFRMQVTSECPWS